MLRAVDAVPAGWGAATALDAERDCVAPPTNEGVDVWVCVLDRVGVGEGLVGVGDDDGVGVGVSVTDGRVTGGTST